MILTNKLMIFITMLLCSVAFSYEAKARDFEIVAIVDDNVITNHQMQDRITIALRSSNIKDTPSSRAKLALQILELLIDETLQKQESERRNISISEAEINRAKLSLMKQNNLKEGDFNKFIKKHRLPKESFVEQMKAQLLWQKMSLKIILPRIFITKSDVLDFVERVTRERDGNEVLISEILIPVMMPEQEEDAKKLATKLVDELDRGGDFESFAKQFSRSSTANKGGKVGWLPEIDLDPNIKDKLHKLKIGEVTRIIRTGAGYLIMKLNDKRKRESSPTPPNEEKVKDFLTRKKAELDSRKFMKNLRRNAYIERRI